MTAHLIRLMIKTKLPPHNTGNSLALWPLVFQLWHLHLHPHCLVVLDTSYFWTLLKESYILKIIDFQIINRVINSALYGEKTKKIHQSEICDLLSERWNYRAIFHLWIHLDDIIKIHSFFNIIYDWYVSCTISYKHKKIEKSI